MQPYDEQALRKAMDHISHVAASKSISRCYPVDEPSDEAIAQEGTNRMNQWVQAREEVVSQADVSFPEKLEINNPDDPREWGGYVILRFPVRSPLSDPLQGAAQPTTYLHGTVPERLWSMDGKLRSSTYNIK